MTFLWLWRVFASVARGRVEIRDDVVDIQAGRLATVILPRIDIERITLAHWRDIPTGGTSEARGYVNLTSPSEPTVILYLRNATSIRLMGLISTSATRIALHVDEPGQLVAALSRD